MYKQLNLYRVLNILNFLVEKPICSIIIIYIIYKNQKKGCVCNYARVRKRFNLRSR